MKVCCRFWLGIRASKQRGFDSRCQCFRILALANLRVRRVQAEQIARQEQ
jgi:hypothetical protein